VQKISTGNPNEEELTPCMLSLLRISEMLCLKDPPLVVLEPAVQVHHYPLLPPQSVDTIANGETRITIAEQSVLIQGN